jgi:hypothetical protein
MDKTKRPRRLRKYYRLARRTVKRKKIKKEGAKFLLLPLVLFSILFFRDIGSIDSKDDFKTKDLDKKIEKLERAWKNGSLIDFLREKGVLRSTLIKASESLNITSSTKRNVLSIMSFMFPDDVPNKLLIDRTAARRMKVIETSPKKYKAQLEYKLLERETHLTLKGVYLTPNTLENHSRILNIYRDIAGVPKNKLERKNENEEENKRLF